MAIQALQPIGKSLSGRFSLDSGLWDEDLPVISEPVRPVPSWSQERTGNPTFDTSASGREERRQVAPIVKLRPSARPGQFQALQQWEAVVLDVTADSVWVELNDLTNKQSLVEEAELLLAEVPENDRKLLEPGSVLYWSIGLETASGGQIQKVSRIRAKRSASWSAHQILKIDRKAAALFESMANEQEHSASTG